ncbi:hypothetical protein [Romboutsia sp. 1001285H_161024_C4]|uniref:hypothetical protein n=1 Tax=Romboutsia sp. 1001285H_161024_C4 TaxID=2787109 RepID=UPI0018995C6C|nr:hypothetical protein [Romboutsia sp. 1001285H_161024_C4]
MNDIDFKLIYTALGSLMLVLLQTTVFQNAIGLTSLIGIPYLGDITFILVKILSFIGVIIFIITSLKLIFKAMF